MAEYLLYWRYETAEQLQGAGELEYVASDQLGSVRPGDRVWTVTFRQDTPYLVGYVDVAEVVGKAEAERRIESRPLWGAGRYAIAGRSGRQRASFVDLTGLVSELSFDGRIGRLPEKLTFTSFRRIRRLTANSAELLRRLWAGRRDSAAAPALSHALVPGESYSWESLGD